MLTSGAPQFETAATFDTPTAAVNTRPAATKFNSQAPARVARIASDLAHARPSETIVARPVLRSSAAAISTITRPRDGGNLTQIWAPSMAFVIDRDGLHNPRYGVRRVGYLTHTLDGTEHSHAFI